MDLTKRSHSELDEECGAFSPAGFFQGLHFTSVSTNIEAFLLKYVPRSINEDLKKKKKSLSPKMLHTAILVVLKLLARPSTNTTSTSIY